MFGNMSFTRKLTLGIGLPVFLLVAIAVIAFNALTQTTTGFTEYRSLARETAILGRIQANLLLMDRFAQKYIQTGDKAMFNGFTDRSELTKTLFKDTEQLVKNDEHLAYVYEARDGLKPYNKAFDQIVEFRGQRNELVLKQLDVLGPKTQRHLTKILRASEKSGNTHALYETSLALRSLLLGRVYVGKFLDTNRPDHAKRVFSEFADMKRS